MGEHADIGRLSSASLLLRFESHSSSGSISGNPYVDCPDRIDHFEIPGSNFDDEPPNATPGRRRGAQAAEIKVG